MKRGKGNVMQKSHLNSGAITMLNPKNVRNGKGSKNHLREKTIGAMLSNDTIHLPLFGNQERSNLRSVSFKHLDELSPKYSSIGISCFKGETCGLCVCVFSPVHSTHLRVRKVCEAQQCSAAQGHPLFETRKKKK